MKTFVIDSENNITAFSAGQPVPEAEGSERFKSSDELGRLAATWPVGRLVEIWNSLPGVTPVKKFMDRKTAVRRVWAAIQRLGEEPAKKANVAEQRPCVAPVRAKSAHPGQPRQERPSKSLCRACRQQDGEDRGASRAA